MVSSSEPPACVPPPGVQSLVGLNFNQEAREADFRYNLVGAREKGEGGLPSVPMSLHPPGRQPQGQGVRMARRNLIQQIRNAPQSSHRSATHLRAQVRVRENAESIAFYRGEQDERAALQTVCGRAGCLGSGGGDWVQRRVRKGRQG